MAYKDFYNDYKAGKLSNTLFFHGEEDYLMDWATDLLVNDNVDEMSRSLDLQIIDGENCAVSDITSAARAYSMFSERRVVVVRNYRPAFKKVGTKQDEDELLTLIGSDNDSSILIFTVDAEHSGDINAFGKKLIKACGGYDFARLEKAELKGFIKKKVREAGNILGQREMDYLIDLSGYYNKNSEYYLKNIMADLDRINNAAAGDQITNALIEELMVGEADRFVFNLIDSMMAGDKRASMTLATEIAKDDDAIMQVIGLLTKQFEIMYDAIELSNEGMSIPQIAKATKINEFRLKKAYQSARHFSKSRLKELLIKLYNIDKDIKSGNLDKELAFELFVVGV